jgi:transcriptional regulator with XRE-family HTH domain
MKLGDVLKIVREMKGVPLAELAAKSGIEAEELQRMEAGKSPLEEYALFLIRFSEVTQVPMQDLFYSRGVPFDKLDDYP